MPDLPSEFPVHVMVSRVEGLEMPDWTHFLLRVRQ